jgi:hypothetical protein
MDPPGVEMRSFLPLIIPVSGISFICLFHRGFIYFYIFIPSGGARGAACADTAPHIHTHEAAQPLKNSFCFTCFTTPRNWWRRHQHISQVEYLIIYSLIISRFVSITCEAIWITLIGAKPN